MGAETEFDRLAAMLPFYVNRTLDEAGCRQVEVTLAVSAELRERLEEERELAASVISDTKAGLKGSGSRDEVCLQEIIAGLPQDHSEMDRAPSPPQTRHTEGPDSALPPYDPCRWNLAAVLGAGLLVLGGVAGWQATRIDQLKAQNTTLLSGENAPQQAGGIMVEFSADAQWDAISLLLAAEGLAITSSTAFGAVILHHKASDRDLAKLVERLRASPLVAAAHPAG